MDIVRALPAPLTRRPATPGAASYSLSGVRWDYAIGGLPWLSATADDKPMTVGLAQIRKDQFDANREPGEQSLSDWWRRSQSTFIGGEGMLYQDPDQVSAANLQNRHAIQYGHSVGVNPWVNGQLTMLRSTSQRVADASGNAHLLLGYNDGTDRYWSAVGSALKSDDGTTATAVTWGGAGTIQSLTSDGTNYYAADATAVYKGTGAGAGASWTTTGTANVVAGYAKGRIMLALDNKMYECDGAGTKTLRFTHLNPSFMFSCIAEGTNAIYAAGAAGSQGSIYKFVLDGTGAVPTLASGGVQTAQLPLGETVLSMTTYLGTFVGLGTSRGFRVGEIDSNGDIAYGPLLIQISGGVKSVAAYDRFFFVAGTNSIDGQSGLWRVDLGQIIQDAGATTPLFAYATDLQAHVTGTVSAVTNFGNSDRMVFAVVGTGSFLESASTLEPSGYFETGRVRFSTLEPKLFKFVTVRTPASVDGTVTASIIDPGGATTSILSVSGGSAAITNILLPAPGAAVEWVQLRLDLLRSGTDATKGPVINGWQLQALPGARRQQVYELALECFDFETDQTGLKVGWDGRAAERLAAFQQLAIRGDAVSFQDLAAGTSLLVLIDDFKFEQKAAPSTTAVTGGTLYVQLRTIGDVVTQ